MNQKTRMKQQGSNLLIYVVEGDLDRVSKVYKCQCGRGCLVKCATPPVTILHVRELIAKLPDEGFEVVLTTGYRDTLFWIEKMTKALLKHIETNTFLTLNDARAALNSVKPGNPSSREVSQSVAKQNDPVDDDVILLSPESSSNEFSISALTPKNKQPAAVDLITPDSADEGDTDNEEAPPSGLLHKKRSLTDQLKREGFKSENIEFAMEALCSNDVAEVRSWLIENVGVSHFASSSSFSSPITMPLKCAKCGSSTVNDVGYCWDCGVEEMNKRASTPSSSRKAKAKTGTLKKAKEPVKKNTAVRKVSSPTVVDLLDDSDEDMDVSGVASQGSTATPTKPVRTALEEATLSTSKKKRQRRNSSQASSSLKSPGTRTNEEMKKILKSRGHAIPAGSKKEDLIRMLSLPAYPELIINRKRRKEWVPRDSKWIMALLIAYGL